MSTATREHTQTTGQPCADFPNVVRSELLKLRSVRSISWTLLSAAAFTVVLAALAAIFIPTRLSPEDATTIDPVRLSLAGLHLSQIAFGVAGVLVIASEYGTGAIRATFTAVPRRREVLAAKATVFTVTAAVIGTVSCLAAYFTFQALLSEAALVSSIDDPGVPRAVVGGGLYLVVLGLLGFGLATILRSSTAAVAALLGLLFVPQILVELLPGGWRTTVGPYLPMRAGEQVYILRGHEAGSLGAWTGFGVFCLYAATALTVAFVLINHRDA